MKVVYPDLSSKAFCQKNINESLFCFFKHMQGVKSQFLGKLGTFVCYALHVFP